MLRKRPLLLSSRMLLVSKERGKIHTRNCIVCDYYSPRFSAHPLRICIVQIMAHFWCLACIDDISSCVEGWDTNVFQNSVMLPQNKKAVTWTTWNRWPEAWRYKCYQPAAVAASRSSKSGGLEDLNHVDHEDQCSVCHTCKSSAGYSHLKGFCCSYIYHIDLNISFFPPTLNTYEKVG